MRILLIEDHLDLAAELSQAFARNGLTCDVAPSAGDAELMIKSVAYAVILLDLGLPDEDGLSLLKRLRSNGMTALTLILTARGELDNRIKGLSVGADDYVVKPFHFDELLARVRALLRRVGGYHDPIIKAGALALDDTTRQFSIADQPLHISVREGAILELLMRRANKVVPKRLIEDQLFGMDDDLSSNAIEVYVHRIRRRLKETGLALSVQTVRGVGYILLT